MAHSEKRGNGPYPWRVKYKLPNGKWGSKSGFATEREADAYGLDQESDVRRGTFIDPRDGAQPLRQFDERWFQSLDVDSKTEYEYGVRRRKHILPRWGDTPMREITALDFRTWEKGLRAEYAKNTVDGIVSVMRMMLDDAVADRVVPFNPIPRPTRRGRYKPQQAQEEIWATDVQVVALAENARIIWGFMGYALVVTLAYTGMRINELAGLKRERCHLLAKKHEQWIDVQKQAKYVRGKYKLAPCKYGSERPIVVPPFLGDLLAQLLASHDAEYVFTTPTGKQLIVNGTFYERFWRPAVAGREGKPPWRGKERPAIPAIPGVEEMNPHGLRHGHNVWLDEDFIHGHVAIERRMGHKVKGVKGVYSHVSTPMTRQISERLQQRWERSTAAEEPGDRAAVGESS